VRDPSAEKARQLVGHGEEVFQGDLEDSDSLARALDGVHGVYSVQPYTDDAATEIKQGIALIEAANRQDVSHFVYGSVVAADEHTGIAHFESKGKIEEHLRISGLNYTILRPVFFMENWQTMFSESISRGEIPLPLSPATRLQMIAVDDIGAFAALAFEHPGKWHNRVFSLAGDELSMQETAAAFSRISSREVRYVQVPWEQFEKQGGHELTVMYRWFETDGYHVDLDGVRREYPQTMTFNRWLEGYWSASSAAAV
jgi:uncharacterized protein YbjT (DUF2867 family)